MPSTTAPAKTKVSVNLSGEVADQINEVANRKGISVSDLIRRAISTQLFVEAELDEKNTFLIRSPDGELERVTFLFG